MEQPDARTIRFLPSLRQTGETALRQAVPLLCALAVSVALLFSLRFLHDATIGSFRARAMAELGIGGSAEVIGEAVLVPNAWLMKAGSFLGGDARSFVRAQSLRFFLMIVPFEALSLVGVFLLSFSGALFTVLLAWRGSAGAAAAELPSRFLPMLRVLWVMFLRSCAWLPFLGVLLGPFLFSRFGGSLMAGELAGFLLFTALAPRTALAPFLLLDGASPAESMRRSLPASRGHRWTILAGAILALLVSLAILLLLERGLALGIPFRSPLHGFFTLIFRQGAWLGAMLFLAHLARAILADAADVVRQSSPQVDLPLLDGSMVGQQSSSHASESFLRERGGGVDDGVEGCGLEGSAAHEPAVHVGL